MRAQTKLEEFFNSITHGLGVILSFLALKFLVSKALLTGSKGLILSFSIYGISLVALYLASTLYHGMPLSRAKEIFRTFDHTAIYFLIAGTYTPFCLITLRGIWGWSLLVIAWGLTLWFEELFDMAYPPLVPTL